MLAVIDNYDSFTFNLVQAFGELGAEVRVWRHDAIRPDALLALGPEAVVISPGPGGPAQAGVSCDVIRLCLGRVPLLGICLGMQCLAAVCGGRIVRAPLPVHGSASPVTHDGRGLFAGLPSPFPAMRYHSLAVEEASLPAELSVTARSDDGVVMGLRHRGGLASGVQFHPESVLTPDGPRLLAAFLALARGGRA